MKRYLLPLYAAAVFAALVYTFIGMMPAVKTPTYFTAALQKSAQVENALTQAGFEILGKAKFGKKKHTVIIFTDETLKNAAAAKGRGFVAASMRVIVNKEAKELRVTNPEYFLRAYMQDTFNDEASQKVMAKLQTAFSGLTPSSDKLKQKDLASFQFMMGMPKFSDTWELAAGDHDALMKKFHKKVKNNLVFELKLSEKSTLVGVKVKKRTMKFVDKIGAQNALVLPWSVLIQDGKAVALDAKYQIALCYPLLTMNEFMTIATVPGAIEKDLKKYFK